MAEKKAIELSQEMGISLACINPTLVVGPMLQKDVNRSMSYIPQIFSRTSVPNDSMSFIDVRDCAEHHVNCYEKNLTGRFMSLKESWHWEDIINTAYEIAGKSDPPKFEGEKIRVTKFNNDRMKLLGVEERSN